MKIKERQLYDKVNPCDMIVLSYFAKNVIMGQKVVGSTLVTAIIILWFFLFSFFFFLQFEYVL